MGDTSIANRLHRSGAIDFNVEYATRQANINLAPTNPGGKRMWTIQSLGPGNDSLSVCEGEPLYNTKRSKGNHYSSVDSCRNPISCMSSLNGYVPYEGAEKMEKIFDQLSKMRCATPAEQAQVIAKYDQLRDIFFSGLNYCGIAVSKWAYERLGHQQDQFVATLGGLNTIYVDEEVNAGDMLCIDIPYPNEMKSYCVDECDKQQCYNSKPWGFVQFNAKKGTPRNKVVLVVRVLPGAEISQKSPEVRKAMRRMREKFTSRGQVIGKCVKGAKKGERCDLVLGGNAMGCYTHSSKNYAEEDV